MQVHKVLVDMNIFFLDANPALAAQMQHDKHVVKMVLETAQILSTVQAHHGAATAPLYKATHAGHPCVKWAAESTHNYDWLVAHGLALAAEYTYRYGKVHKSAAVILRCVDHPYRLPVLGPTPPAQAMPDEFKRPHNAVQAYQAYYLGRKVEQSRWTRRPVPAFVTKESTAMAKKQVEPKAPTLAPADAPRAYVRGPRGVAPDALIFVQVPANPKRPGSRAWTAFSHYGDGMTVAQYVEAVGKAGTANLVYDASHGFITIEGYEPKAPREPRAPKEPKAAKPAKIVAVKAAKPVKAKKEKAAKAPPAPVESEVVEETIA